MTTKNSTFTGMLKTRKPENALVNFKGLSFFYSLKTKKLLHPGKLHPEYWTKACREWGKNSTPIPVEHLGICRKIARELMPKKYGHMGKYKPEPVKKQEKVIEKKNVVESKGLEKINEKKKVEEFIEKNNKPGGFTMGDVMSHAWSLNEQSARK